MKAYIFSALFLMVFCSHNCKGDLPTFENFRHNTIIQDPQTKTSYYIESDRRHVAAISSAGSLLWCSEIIPEKWSGKMFVLKISFEKVESPANGDFVDVSVWRVGQGGGRIDKKTGVYTDSGKTL